MSTIVCQATKTKSNESSFSMWLVVELRLKTMSCPFQICLFRFHSVGYITNSSRATQKLLIVNDLVTLFFVLTYSISKLILSFCFRLFVQLLLAHLICSLFHLFCQFNCSAAQNSWNIKEFDNCSYWRWIHSENCRCSIRWRSKYEIELKSKLKFAVCDRVGWIHLKISPI